MLTISLACVAGAARREKGSSRRLFARSSEVFASREKVGCGIRHKPRDPTHQGVNKHNKVCHFGFRGGGQRRVTQGHAPASHQALRPPPPPSPKGRGGNTKLRNLMRSGRLAYQKSEIEILFLSNPQNHFERCHLPVRDFLPYAAN